ncbi:hypothetical protein [Klebsiella quasipneumoniae]|nr:hypothetical protein [Klebsiella quasipneumoniae]
MKVLSIVGATLLVTSFHAAAFVSVSPVPAGQNANVMSCCKQPKRYSF